LKTVGEALKGGFRWLVIHNQQRGELHELKAYPSCEDLIDLADLIARTRVSRMTGVSITRERTDIAQPEANEERWLWGTPLRQDGDATDGGGGSAPSASSAAGTGETTAIQGRNLHTSENGDRWDLLRGADGEVFVRHTGNVSSGGHVSDIPLGEFLTLARDAPEHQAMWRLLGSLIDREND
jgi:hypothetical protein